MSIFSEQISILIEREGLTKQQIIAEIARIATTSGYTVADTDDSRPWGGFARFGTENGDDFTLTYFSVNPIDARQGNLEASLSPKILYVDINQRLSWQRHKRRAERWMFLTDGYYFRSNNPNEPGEPIFAPAGTEVQFAAGECHRLMGYSEYPTYVAEIWQHTDPDSLSDEDDIERLQDDYKR